MPELRTYDVFDTCLVRIVGAPSSVFLLLGLDLVAARLWPGSAEQFASARAVAQARALKHVDPHEVQLLEIYDELRDAYDLSADQARAIVAAELALERSLLRRVPGIADKLDEARAQGHTVAFVSDMYLPHEQLFSWLSDLGVASEGEVLWLSSDKRATKSSGDLFELVRAAHPLTGTHWVHTGDNARSDVAVPRGLGVTTRHYVDCHLDDNERAMEAEASQTCGISSLLAGAARWVRLNRSVDEDPALHAVATGIGAPVIYAFVLWTLQEAKRRSLRKIWFMARDGQVMLPVARTLARRLGLDVELGYLYGGRQVVRVASLVSIDEQALDWLTGGAGLMTLQAVLDRVGVAAEDVFDVALTEGLPLEAPIGWDRMDRLRRFLRHADVSQRILANASARRGVVLDYFRRCGLVDGEPCAVVDIGWKGNVLRSIVDLIGIDQAARHTFMYFGSFAHAKNCEAVPKVAYLFDLRGKRRFGTGADIPSITTLMEIFCQADHGQVMQLERKGGGFEPQCRPSEHGPGGSRWNVDHFQRAVQQFAETVPIERFLRCPIDLRDVCDRLLRRLATHPTAEEIDLLAPIGFVDDQGGSQPHPFAQPYTFKHLRAAFRSGNAAPAAALNWWSAAAVGLTTPALRWAMRLAAKAGRIRAQKRQVSPSRKHAAT